MKTFLCLVASLLLTIAAISQTTLYEDDFESYTVGSYIAVTNPGWWATWTNAPGTGEDGIVSDNFSESGAQSLYITWEDGITDALLNLGDKTSGAFKLDWYMLVESGYGGYYNIQHFESPGIEWAFEVYFNNGGTGKLRVGNDEYEFNYPQDSWFSVEQLFNLDADQATLEIDGEEIKTWPFHYEVNSTDGTNQLGAVNFNDGLNFRCYVDDVEYDSLSLAGIWSPGSSRNEFSVSLYPNPAYDHMAVTSTEEMTELEILDQVGQTIFQQVAANKIIDLDLSGYKSGVYFLRVRSAKGLSTQKIVIQ